MFQTQKCGIGERNTLAYLANVDIESSKKGFSDSEHRCLIFFFSFSFTLEHKEEKRFLSKKSFFFQKTREFKIINSKCSSNFSCCSEAVFLVVCDPSMNELRATETGPCIDLYGSRSFIEGSHTTKNRASKCF